VKLKNQPLGQTGAAAAKPAELRVTTMHHIGVPEIITGMTRRSLPARTSRVRAALLALGGCAVFSALAAEDGARPAIEAVFDLPRAQSNESEFLAPEDAFRFAASADGPDRVLLTWQIAEGYYLYRSRLKAVTSSPDAQLGRLVLPKGKTKTDEYFGEQEVYYGELTAALPVAKPGTSALALPIDVTYQGCADAGLCYPPETRTVSVQMPAGGASASGFVSRQDWFADLIRSESIPVLLGWFFLAGLGLSLTPCVLPMIPILSGIIAGQGARATTARSFALSLTYVLGMALTYTLAGALFAAAGQQVQAVFQQPWIVTSFALLFVLLALSMFGLFTVQVPAALQTRIADLSNRQSAGTFGGVAVMGALSALIVTTCVAPPLIGALTVIAQTGDVYRGAAALFTMSLGMGAPLLVVGASAGKLLPRAGPWMDTVKHVFGVMMLVVAAWMLERIVPARMSLLLWAVPAFAGSWVLWTAAVRSGVGRLLARAAGVAAALYGCALITGAVLGAKDPLAPLPQLAARHSELPFRTIKSVADLEREIATARVEGRATVLDFYADWCVSCKEMEKYTFTDAAVQSTLAGVSLLRADVTANDELDRALLQHFGIFGPPTIAFYGPDGLERRNFRVVGYMKADEFAALAAQAIGPTSLAAADEQ
jgi:thioredoxin:protein disulfide reductase